MESKNERERERDRDRMANVHKSPKVKFEANRMAPRGKEFDIGERIVHKQWELSCHWIRVLRQES